MAIIVRHKNDGKIYVLIGTGYGVYKSATPSFLGGNLFPNEEKGEIPVAAVTDEKGEIQWFHTDELKVIEIDGVEICEVLAKHKKTEQQNMTGLTKDVCPACAGEISVDDTTCPWCGLVFQIEEE